MASIQRLDLTKLSNPEVGLYNAGGGPHRNFGTSLVKSHNFRDGHEARAISGNGPASLRGEAPALTSVLFLESISLPSAKSSAQVELRRAMNAASGQQNDDPSLGCFQCKALESSSGEEIKRMRAGLLEGVSRAKERVRNLSEAVIKLDRFQHAMESRKRSKPLHDTHDQEGHPGGVQRGALSRQLSRGSGRGASSSKEGSGMQQGDYKSKSGMVHKRMRTSLADARPEGRPSNLSVQRSSGIQDKERESPRSSNILHSSVEEKDRAVVGGGEGYEKTKMKGKRSATTKGEVAIVNSSNGSTDADRESKESAVHHRGGVDGRSRLSEGQGLRSTPPGPVHGTLSVQRAETVAHANSGGIRGGGNPEVEGFPCSLGKVEPSGCSERVLMNLKTGPKPVSRDEARSAGLGVLPKAKRSNLVAGGNQAGHVGQSSSFTDVREKPSVMTSPTKVSVPSGAMIRKGLAPSRSSSPPVASWGSSRPQKMARVRRVNLNPPVNISLLEEAEAKDEAHAVAGDKGGSASGAVPSVRSNSSSLGGGMSVAKRALNGEGFGPNKSNSERVTISVGVELVEETAKCKVWNRKEEEEEGECRGSGGWEKLGSTISTIEKENPLVSEESGGGDGVRRQGRTGRGSVMPRMVTASCLAEKMEVSPVNAKLTRSARSAVFSKLSGVVLPGSTKGNAARKSSSRLRRFTGNIGAEMTEDDVDHEHLSRAIQQAVEFSEAVCPNNFWRQVEPYFSYVTSDNLSFLRKHMAVVDETNATSQSQSLDAAFKAAVIRDRASYDDVVKNLDRLKEQNLKDRSFNRGRSRGWYDRFFPLTQRLLSAFITERDDDRSENVNSEACTSQGSGCSLLPSTLSQMECDRRDAEGEADVHNLKSESEWWSARASQEGFSEGCQAWDEYQDRSTGADAVVEVEVFDRGHDARFRWKIENGCMDWEQQYARMSLDDRLLVELSSIGLLSHEQEEDDIGEELRRLENCLLEQVSNNKERLCRLESAVLESRVVEGRAREKLVMDILLELAYKKNSRGRLNKGAAAKVAKAAALAFAKRVLIRVQNFEAGNSCVTDPALRERLFCVASSTVEVSPSVAMDVVKTGGAVAASAERVMTPSLAEKSCCDSQSAGVDWSYLKEGSRISRAKERGVFLEDVSGYTSTCDVNMVSSNGYGEIKDKRSERERDGKVKGRGALERPGQRNAKGERKMKTNPRQKTGFLLKSVQGLMPTAVEQQHDHNMLLDHVHSAAIDRHVGIKEEVVSCLPVFREADEQVDLSAIPLPGMEELGMAQADMGSWLDFDLDDSLQQTDDFLMGLDVPMDDLSGLHMMM